MPASAGSTARGGASIEGRRTDEDELLETSFSVLALLGRGYWDQDDPLGRAARNGVAYILRSAPFGRAAVGDDRLSLAEVVAVTAIIEGFGMGPTEAEFPDFSRSSAFEEMTSVLLRVADARGGVAAMGPEEGLALAWAVQAAIDALLSQDWCNPIRTIRLLRLGAGLVAFGAGEASDPRGAQRRDVVAEEIRSGGHLARLFLWANGDREFGEPAIPADLIDRTTFDPAVHAQALRAVLIYQATGDDLTSACRTLRTTESEESTEVSSDVIAKGDDQLYGPSSRDAARVLIMQTARRYYRWFKDE